MRLYLIRHPRSTIAAHICYGGTDVRVTVQEREACLSKLLADASLPQGLPIYSSPLGRCADLARRLAESRGVAAPVLDARLKEMSFGDWELREWSRIPRQDIDDWVADMAGYRPGGGESVLDMARRVLDFRKEWMAHGRDACVVCHAGTIRLLVAANGHRSLEETALAAARATVRIGYGQIVVLPVYSGMKAAAQARDSGPAV